ncbi:MAG: shikimate dehydrogenase [Candidatus Omnitrophota bacterium]|nr:shikimate dehydrogenase [Candidatus Omnitrophota bacterium]
MDIYGVIGWPVKHTLSPFMHNAAFKKLGIDAEYLAFEIPPEKLEDFILNRKDVAGFNITIPHKIKAREILKKNFHVVNSFSYPYYDTMTGAVNTVKRNGDDIEYCNTDPVGFRHSLVNDLKLEKTKGKTALIIGCGGASRAVVAELTEPANYIKKIYLYDISKDTVDSAKRYYSEQSQSKLNFIYDSKELLKLKDELDLLVNASPVGMEEGDDRLAVPKDLLCKRLYVFDLVYNRKTELFKEASALGCHVVDGKGMLAAQGAFSFSLWRAGIKPVDVVDVMRKELDKALFHKTSMT